ncbi:MAG: EAL domain-containing protein [Pseudomonadota bacterium]
MKIHFYVVVEGVEEREQLAVLTEAGCDYIQGYYFSKPLPANDVVPFLTQFSREQ